MSVPVSACVSVSIVSLRDFVYSSVSVSVSVYVS